MIQAKVVRILDSGHILGYFGDYKKTLDIIKDKIKEDGIKLGMDLEEQEEEYGRRNGTNGTNPIKKEAIKFGNQSTEE